MAEVTIITGTTGGEHLAQNVRSVLLLGERVEHWLVVDGIQHEYKVLRVLQNLEENEGLDVTRIKVTVLEENTGGDGYYGHRIYSAFGLLCNTPFVSMLDEDCYVEPTWLRMVNFAQGHNVVTCRRRLVYNGKYLGVDCYESIGKNMFGYHLYDINTYLVRQEYWKYLVPTLCDKWGADRHTALAVAKDVRHISDALVNYRVRDDRINFYRKIAE